MTIRRTQYRQVILAGAAAVVAVLCGHALAGGAPPPRGNRAPAEMAFAPDGRRLYVTEAATGTVAVIDALARKVVSRFATGGVRPGGLAVSADGAFLVVANGYSANVVVLDATTGAQRMLVPLAGEPWGVALAPDGKRAYVAVSQLDQIAILDLGRGEVVARVSVGRRPRAVALTPDGLTLAVANQAGGSVSVINTEALTEEARVRLKGVNVRGLALGADDAEVYATLMPAFNARPTADPAMVWHNLVQAVTLNGPGSTVGEDQWLDFVRVPDAKELLGSPDPSGIVIDSGARFAWFAVAGRDVLQRITIHDRKRDAIWPISQVEVRVGANPRAVALTPDGRELWVANYMGNSLTVVDAAAMNALATVDLGTAPQADPALEGRRLFNSAAATRTQRFTCASCHPDGASDGLTWSFTHVQDGFTRRNSRDLRTGVVETPPFRWSGLEQHLQDFLRDEVTGLLGGPPPDDHALQALTAALRAFEPPPNPYRLLDGAHSSSGERGRLLFEGKAACVSCHAGPRRGGTGLKAWVGTTPGGRQVDVPHLTGVHDGAPYLHDGRAETLQDVFSRHNPDRDHGQAHVLSPDELTDLLQYLREL